MKNLLSFVVIALLAATLSVPSFAAGEAPAAPADLELTDPGQVLHLDPETATCTVAASPEELQFDPTPCMGPNPPLSCQCWQGCCESCKCWSGYFLALCGPMQE